MDSNLESFGFSLENIFNTNEDFCTKENEQETLKNMQAKKPKRWEELYYLNQVQQEAKSLIQDLKRNQELENQEVFPFKPQISSYSQNLKKRQIKQNFYDKELQWKKKKEEKLEVLQKSQIVNEIKKCTFKPLINQSNANLKTQKKNLHDQKSIQTFIERQQKAREEKKKKELFTQSDKYNPNLIELKNNKNCQSSSQVNRSNVVEEKQKSTNIRNKF